MDIMVQTHTKVVPYIYISSRQQALHGSSEQFPESEVVLLRLGCRSLAGRSATADTRNTPQAEELKKSITGMAVGRHETRTPVMSITTWGP